MDVKSARLQEKGRAVRADTFCPPTPRHLRPRTLPGSRAALRAAAAPLSSAHLPGGPGCCPPGPRLRLSPPFLPSRLRGPSNFPECARPGPQRRRGGRRRGERRPREPRVVRAGREARAESRPLGSRGGGGRSRSPGAPGGFGRLGKGGPGRHLLRAGARAGASLVRALPTAVSHFLGILPLVFISLRRKLGLKKKKKKRRKSNHSSYSSGEAHGSSTAERQLAFVPRHLGWCLLSPAAEGRRSSAGFPPRGAQAGAPDPRGCVTVGTRTSAAARLQGVGLQTSDPSLGSGMGRPGTPGWAWTPGSPNLIPLWFGTPFPAAGSDLNLLAFQSSS